MPQDVFGQEYIRGVFFILASKDQSSSGAFLRPCVVKRIDEKGIVAVLFGKGYLNLGDEWKIVTTGNRIRRPDRGVILPLFAIFDEQLLDLVIKTQVDVLKEAG